MEFAVMPYVHIEDTKDVVLEAGLPTVLWDATDVQQVAHNPYSDGGDNDKALPANFYMPASKVGLGYSSVLLLRAMAVAIRYPHINFIINVYGGETFVDGFLSNNTNALALSGIYEAMYNHDILDSYPAQGLENTDKRSFEEAFSECFFPPLNMIFVTGKDLETDKTATGRIIMNEKTEKTEQNEDGSYTVSATFPKIFKFSGKSVFQVVAGAAVLLMILGFLAPIVSGAEVKGRLGVTVQVVDAPADVEQFAEPMAIAYCFEEINAYKLVNMLANKLQSLYALSMSLSDMNCTDTRFVESALPVNLTGFTRQLVDTVYPDNLSGGSVIDLWRYTNPKSAGISIYTWAPSLSRT